MSLPPLCKHIFNLRFKIRGYFKTINKTENSRSLFIDIQINMSELLKAAEAGNFQEVKRIIQSGADVNEISLYKNLWTETVLHKAVGSGSLEIVKYLVEHGAKLTRQDCRGQDAVLSLACFVGNQVIVDYLLQHGAIVDLNRQVGSSLLFKACSWGHTADVKTLLKYNVDIRKERVLECGNDEIINILKHELEKSIKHRDKIEILKTMVNEKMVKVICLRMICF